MYVQYNILIISVLILFLFVAGVYILFPPKGNGKKIEGEKWKNKVYWRKSEKSAQKHQRYGEIFEELEKKLLVLSSKSEIP